MVEPSDEVLKLITSDGAVFYVEQRYALVSKFIKDALASGSLESVTKEIKLQEIDAATLETVVEYLHYNYKYQELIDKDKFSAQDVPRFQIAPENGLAVLVASIFLQC